MNKTQIFLYAFLFIILNLEPLHCGKNHHNADQEQEYSLTSQLKAEARFHRFTHGDVIYVYGTSTAGKTTFTKVLSKLSGYTLISTRDLKAIYMTKIISETFPKEYSYASKFFSPERIHSYLSNSIHSIPKESLSNDNSNKAIKMLETIRENNHLITKRYHPTEQLYYLYDYLFMLSRKKVNIIVDNLDVLDFLSYISFYNIHCPLHMLLMYCPLHIILERVQKRNELAIKSDILDKRSLMRPLEGFLDIYTQSSNENFIEEIEQKDFLAAFNSTYIKSKEGNDSHPLSKLSWQEIQNILRDKFGSNPTIRLQSKYPYDMILDTSKETPEELASIIPLRTGN